MSGVTGAETVMARVLSRHRLTLPREVRRDLGVTTGDLLLFERLPSGDWVVRCQPRGLLALADRIHAEAVGQVTIAEARAGWAERV